MAGSADFILTVNGSGFVNESVVQWNNSDRSTTFVSSTQLKANILSTDILNVGPYNVTVVNPPGGISNISNVVTFSVTAPPPVPTGNLMISKHAQGGNETFNFTVRNSSNNIVASPSITTVGGIGSVSITNLPIGTYTVTEVQPLNPGWIAMDPTPNDPYQISVDVIGGRESYVFFANQARGNLKITKKIPGTSPGGIFEFNIEGPSLIPNQPIKVTVPAGTDQEVSIEIISIIAGSYKINEFSGPAEPNWNNGEPVPGENVTVPINGTGTATFTNQYTPLGSITIKKVTNPSQDPNDPDSNLFTFTTNITTPPDTNSTCSINVNQPTCKNGQSARWSNLFNNVEYAITEGPLGPAMPTNWTLTDIVCKGCGGSGNTCTDQGASSTVTKTYAPDPNNFNNPKILTGISVLLKNRENIICEFKNDVTAPAPATLEIIKINKANTSEKFTFNITDSKKNKIGKNVQSNGSSPTSSNPFTIPPDTYSIAEVLPSNDWILTSAACFNDNGAPRGRFTDKGIEDMTISSGEKITCTFTNNKKPILIIEKIADGGTCNTCSNSESFDFIITPTSPAGTARGLNVTTDANGEGKNQLPNQLSLTPLDPGLYSITEKLPTVDTKETWELNSISCNRGGGNINIPNKKILDLNLEIGTRTTCTFKNTKLGKLRIEKNTIGGDGWFNFKYKNFANTTTGSLKVQTGLDDGPNKGHNTKLLSPDTYSLKEVVPDDWYFISGTCDDGKNYSRNMIPNTRETEPLNFNIQAGRTITCKFTNSTFSYTGNQCENKSCVKCNDPNNCLNNCADVGQDCTGFVCRNDGGGYKCALDSSGNHNCTNEGDACTPQLPPGPGGGPGGGPGPWCLFFPWLCGGGGGGGGDGEPNPFPNPFPGPGPWCIGGVCFPGPGPWCIIPGICPTPGPIPGPLPNPNGASCIDSGNGGQCVSDIIGTSSCTIGQPCTPQPNNFICNNNQCQFALGGKANGCFINGQGCNPNTGFTCVDTGGGYTCQPSPTGTQTNCGFVGQACTPQTGFACVDTGGGYQCQSDPSGTQTNCGFVGQACTTQTGFRCENTGNGGQCVVDPSGTATDCTGGVGSACKLPNFQCVDGICQACPAQCCNNDCSTVGQVCNFTFPQGILEIVIKTDGADGDFDTGSGYTSNGDGSYTRRIAVSAGLHKSSAAKHRSFIIQDANGIIVKGTGFTLDSVSCDKPGDTPTYYSEEQIDFSFFIEPGQTTTCTYDYKSGKLKIVVNTIGGDGTFFAGYYNICFLGSYFYNYYCVNVNNVIVINKNNTVTTSGGSGSFPIIGPLNLKKYAYESGSVFEISQSISNQFLLLSISCDDKTSFNGHGITIQSGQTTICTFTFGKKAKLNIKTETESVPTTNYFRTFSYDIIKNDMNSYFHPYYYHYDNDIYNINYSPDINYSPGNYSVTQTIMNDTTYSSNNIIANNNITSSGSRNARWIYDSASCNISSQPIEFGVNFNLNWGDDVECTFKDKFFKGNGYLNIVKNTTDGIDGTFDYNISGSVSSKASVKTSEGTGSSTQLSLPPGLYNITEEDLSGWTVASAACYPPHRPQTIVDDSSIGTVAWQNPSNASESDYNYARVFLNGDEQSHYLKATDFGFDIPSDATILGVQAYVDKNMIVEPGSFYCPGGKCPKIFGSTINLVKNGTIQTNLTNTSTITNSYVFGLGGYTVLNNGILSYGSNTSLWGTTLTPADVNSSDFGVAVSFNGPGEGQYSSFDPEVSYIINTTGFSCQNNQCVIDPNGTQRGCIDDGQPCSPPTGWVCRRSKSGFFDPHHPPGCKQVEYPYQGYHTGCNATGDVCTAQKRLRSAVVKIDQITMIVTYKTADGIITTADGTTPSVTQATAEILPAQPTACYYTNTPKGILAITTKVLGEDIVDGLFDYNIYSTDSSPAKLSTIAIIASNGTLLSKKVALKPGNYRIIETGPASSSKSWIFDSAFCAVPDNQTNYPSTLENDPSIGGAAWQNSSVYLNNTNSNYLKATNFGFNIPSNATIQGVEVQIERNATNLQNGNVVDNQVSLIKKGKISPFNKAHFLQFWTSEDRLVNYGNDLDLWGETLTPANINSPDFGVAISVGLVNTDTDGLTVGSATANINSITMTVTYTTPSSGTVNNPDGTIDTTVLDWQSTGRKTICTFKVFGGNKCINKQ